MVSKILIVHTIFIKDENSLRRQINSFNSLISILERDITAIGVGWCATDRLFNDYYNYVTSRSDNWVLIRQNENVGKSGCVNNVLDIIDASKYNVVFYLDADIVINFTFNDIRKLENTIGLYVDGKKIVLIAPDQLQDCRHFKLSRSKKIAIEGVRFSYPISSEYSIGIAGGCFMMDLSVLNDMRMSSVGVYGPEDAELMKKIANSNLLAIVCDTISVIHPFDTDTAYVEWKKNKIHNK